MEVKIEKRGWKERRVIKKRNGVKRRICKNKRRGILIEIRMYRNKMWKRERNSLEGKRVIGSKIMKGRMC